MTELNNKLHIDMSIWEFYKDANILITGGLGFVGKVLIEKLLRSCSNLNSINMLVRSKKGRTVEERLEDFLSGQIFNKIRKNQPELLKKVKVINGDICLPNLGLDDQQRKSIIDNINIVFHSAATVRFNEPLRNAILINTVGTERILNLCKEMKNLKSFIHVSTAYSVPGEKIIEEKVYKPSCDPNSILTCLDVVPPDHLEVFTKELLDKHPNTYTFTKSMAEYLVEEWSSIVPSAIVRPAIVSPAWAEPYAGWVDSLAGATGITMEIGRGVIRSVVGEGTYVANLVPVDIVADILITSAWHIKTKGMLRMSWKFHKAVLNVAPFLSNQFTFEHKNLNELIFAVKTNKIDDVFNVDLTRSSFNWSEYFEQFILGTRQYILRDSSDTVAKARRKMEMLQWIRYMFILGTFSFVFFVLLLLHLNS